MLWCSVHGIRSRSEKLGLVLISISYMCMAARDFYSSMRDGDGKGDVRRLQQKAVG